MKTYKYKGQQVILRKEEYRNNGTLAMLMLTEDGDNYGCITVNDSCSYEPISQIRHPVIRKLTLEDFEHVPLTIGEQHTGQDDKTSMHFPNPTEGTLNIPLPCFEQQVRCRIYDSKGIIVTDRIVASDTQLLQFDVSKLKNGLYHYQIYTPNKTLLQGKFVKK